MSDYQIIDEAKRHPHVFGLLYQRHQKAVFRYFMYRLGHRQEAEDLAQETFVKAFSQLRSFHQGKAKYLSYLLTIAHNLLVSYFRKPKAASLERAENVPTPTMIAEQMRIDLALLWRWVAKLPARQQEAFRFYYQCHLNTNEIGWALGRTENAVKLLLSRARRELRRLNTLDEMTLIPQPSV